MTKTLKTLLLLFIIIPCIALGLTGCDKDKDKDMDKNLIKISTLEELKSSIENASEDSTLQLQNNLEINEQVVINKKLTLDLNGKIINNTQEIWNPQTRQLALISVQEGGNLTITGNGKIDALENDCYGIDVRDNAKLIVNNSEVVGNVHAVYVMQGTADILGGKYSIKQTSSIAGKDYEFVLNCLDESYQNETAKINVYGGEFINFNPANNKSENESTNYVVEGFSVENNDNVYRVVKNSQE